MPNRQINICFLLVAMCLCALNAVRAAETEPPIAGAEAAPREEPDAAELVRHVRAEEKKFEQLRSLYMRFTGKNTNTPEGLAQLRGELIGRVREDHVNEKNFPALNPEIELEYEFAFDEHRVYKMSDRRNIYYDLRVWDGNRGYRKRTQGLPTEFQQYSLYEDRETFFNPREWYFFHGLSSFRVSYHKFWWMKEDPLDAWLVNGGEPRVFAYVRPRIYRGRRCFELKSRDVLAHRLFIGAEDHRLYGIVYLELPYGDAALEVYGAISGRRFGNTAEMMDWYGSLSPAEQRHFMEQVYDRFGVRGKESYLDDYREVAPDLWLPSKQGHLTYATEQPETPLKERSDLVLAQIRVNEVLDDELFAIDIPDGSPVINYAFNPPLIYNQKANRSAEEWQRMIEVHQWQINQGKPAVPPAKAD